MESVRKLVKRCCILIDQCSRTSSIDELSMCVLLIFRAKFMFNNALTDYFAEIFIEQWNAESRRNMSFNQYRRTNVSTTILSLPNI
jgi:hypothetical protein